MGELGTLSFNECLLSLEESLWLGCEELLENNEELIWIKLKEIYHELLIGAEAHDVHYIKLPAAF